MQGNKIIIVVVVIFIIAALGFSLFYFTSGSDTAADSTIVVSGPNATDTPAVVASRDFLVVLGKFESITFNTSVLEDRVFASLIDQSVALQQEPMGRPNPFAPLGAEASTTPLIIR